MYINREKTLGNIIGCPTNIAPIVSTKIAFQLTIVMDFILNSPAGAP